MSALNYDHLDLFESDVKSRDKKRESWYRC